jgi:prepilin-type N-terminal cleavage/methylation domain-containing protein
MEKERGFTLVEMIVAVALFAVVMLVSVGALLALVGANRKAQALQSVMNNLNIALDGMVRSVRMGTDYRCNGGGDCANGGDVLSFVPFGGGDRWVYFAEDGRLYKSTTGSTVDGFPMTAPNIEIDSLEFYVVGTTRGDDVQPKVVAVVKGTAGGSQVKTTTTFSIQATAVQRILDI